MKLWFAKYNHQRPHQSLDTLTPAKVYEWGVRKSGRVDRCDRGRSTGPPTLRPSSLRDADLRFGVFVESGEKAIALPPRGGDRALTKKNRFAPMNGVHFITGNYRQWERFDSTL